MSEYFVFGMSSLAAVFFGLWLGERRTRLFLQNMRAYGTPDGPEPAVTYVEPDAESRLETAIDDATGRKRVVRLVRTEDVQAQYDPATIENGVSYLLYEARSRGEQLSRAEAEDEVRRMLNAEGAEMP